MPTTKASKSPPSTTPEQMLARTLVRLPRLSALDPERVSVNVDRESPLFKGYTQPPSFALASEKSAEDPGKTRSAAFEINTPCCAIDVPVAGIRRASGRQSTCR